MAHIGVDTANRIRGVIGRKLGGAHAGAAAGTSAVRRVPLSTIPNSGVQKTIRDINTHPDIIRKGSTKRVFKQLGNLGGFALGTGVAGTGAIGLAMTKG